MHRLNLDFIEKNLKKYNIKPESVLDIGSLDVNGNPRSLFDCEYRGIDIVDGKNVDVVEDVCNLSEFFPYGYDVILCLNTLEHMKEFWRCIRAVKCASVDGAYLFLSVPGISFPEHHKPDYWRFTTQAVKDVIMEGFEILEYEEVPTKPDKNYIINCLGRKL